MEVYETKNLIRPEGRGVEYHTRFGQLIEAHTFGHTHFHYSNRLPL